MWSTTERRTTISLSAPSSPRLRFGPASAGSARTLLDGAWWPRSTDPVAELPGLILAVQEHGHGDARRPVTHVMLRVGDWDSHPRRLRVDGPDNTQVVRLSWFDTLPVGLLTAICAGGRRIDLLTVPAATPHERAQAVMELAARTDGFLHSPDLPALLATPPGRANRSGMQAASENAWESEGGRLRENRPA
ncbi:DUF5994 family protein [Actinomadura macra]|uniref:DUF5994 family protein n=1 Tax=Actinomadura macra TaxID=46164 RepID=UPI0012F70F70|nr:DUF5994 family protein [Actinomadura macra]